MDRNCGVALARELPRSLGTDRKTEVLAALMLVPLGICLAVVRVALYVADRIALRFSWTKKLVRIIGSAASLLVLLFALVGLIVAFGAVANAEANRRDREHWVDTIVDLHGRVAIQPSRRFERR